MRYRVADGTQVHHDGHTYGSGDTIDATEAVAAVWVRAGWVEAQEEPPAPKTRRAKASD